MRITMKLAELNSGKLVREREREREREPSKLIRPRIKNGRLDRYLPVHNLRL